MFPHDETLLIEHSLPTAPNPQFFFHCQNFTLPIMALQLLRWISLLLLLNTLDAFAPSPCASSRRVTAHVSSASTTTPTTSDERSTTSKGLLKRDRYVASNRFSVRQGKAAKFEQRWATRKSRLAQLDGFKYFHLMRRVILNEDGTTTYDEGNDEASAQGNMVSFTVWEKKSDFSAWRSGEAFKEAHGGTSIGAFLST
jgi:heme-degrading monooxygenase HmoA